MESEKTEIDTGLIERCILDCNATRQALEDWEKTRDDDDFKDVIEAYYTESVATVQELQELKSIWEKVSVAQEAQIRELEEKVKRKDKELESKTGEASSYSKSLAQVKEILERVVEGLMVKGEEVEGLDEICRGLGRQEQDDETSLENKSKEQEVEAEAGRLKEQIERLEGEKADSEEQLAQERAVLARARQEFKDKLAQLSASEEKVQGLESEVEHKVEVLMGKSRALREKEEEFRASKRV